MKVVRGGSSTERSTLVFRQETTSRRGQPSSHRGRSSATHGENVSQFEKAGIPIDPMRNKNRKPDSIQRWRWSRSQQKWVIDGERRVKAADKIVTEAQWQKILIHGSRQI